MRQLKISKQITNRESQSLDKYLQEIGKVDLLTPDEEVTLAQCPRRGDVAAMAHAKPARAHHTVSRFLLERFADHSMLTMVDRGTGKKLDCKAHSKVSLQHLCSFATE